MSSYDGPIRTIGFLKRRQDLTEEQFYEHWEKKHAPLVAPWLLRNGVTAYTQVHTSSYFKSLWPPSRGTPPLEWDGFAILEFASLADYERSADEAYYAEVVEPDERRFIDKAVWETQAFGVSGAAKVIVEGGKLKDGLEEGKAWRDWAEDREEEKENEREPKGGEVKDDCEKV